MGSYLPSKPCYSFFRAVISAALLATEKRLGLNEPDRADKIEGGAS